MPAPLPRPSDPPRPLSALISQALVAFTIELDNEFELRMADAGYPGERLSLVLWLDLVRFLTDGMAIRALASRVSSSPSHLRLQLGCLERWGYLSLGPDSVGAGPARAKETSSTQREGWGSGRGIRMDWVLRLSSKGVLAREVWPPLPDLIQSRWAEAFGKEQMRNLVQSAAAVLDHVRQKRPNGVRKGGTLPHTEARLTLPELLSRLLAAFANEFEGETKLSLALAANALRVLKREPIPAGDIPRLTGSSPETSGIGWQLKPYIEAGADPTGKRGQVVQLNARGLAAQRAYHRTIQTIENNWQERCGEPAIERLRAGLLGLFDRDRQGRCLLSLRLTPPPGVVRAGFHAPALGRRTPGPAAEKRMRDLVAQTEAFVADPALALPHYPLWDMNRGFGP